MSDADTVSDPQPHHLLFDGPAAAAAAATVVLAHGAGAPMDSPFMARVAASLAGRGIRVVRFEFPYMRARREDGRRRAPNPQPELMRSWREVVAELGGGAGLVVGGKSLGGRIASMIADEVGARGLLCFGYPFHPPGQPQRLRTRHLAALRTPTLIVQGSRDPFGGPDEVAGYELSPRIRVVWIEDGDHSLTPRKSSGRTAEENLAAAIAAAGDFVLAL
ncbi:MAG TPA: alpha/beta fold hydrolase [Thermoanaerobaculia bacterium]|nr:alpha/beta fold hydrolase [Thermoanaerobaculia bacterium]